MSVAGFEGAFEARILSKDGAGAATRLVRIPARWGSGVVGAFTADLEVFVVSGELEVGREQLGKHDFAAVRQGQVVGGVTARTEVLALLMTSAPIRFDTSAGGPMSTPVVARSADRSWTELPQLPGRYVRPLDDGLAGPVWLSGARTWENTDAPSHSHRSAEEMFVLSGQLAYAEHSNSSVEVVHHQPGSYTFRLSGQRHGGPGSFSSETAMAFHRLHGEHTVDWHLSDTDN